VEDYGLDDRGSISSRGRDFSSSPPLCPDRTGAHKPPTQRIPGAITPGLKRPGHDSHVSSPSSAEVKTAWSYTSTSPYVMAWCLIKHRNTFAVYSQLQV